MLDDIATRMQELVDENVCFSLEGLAVNGKDLIDVGYTAGKELGDMLDELLDQVMREKIANERASLLRYAAEHK